VKSLDALDPGETEYIRLIALGSLKSHVDLYRQMCGEEPGLSAVYAAPMDDETRRAIEAIVAVAKAEIVKIIESSETPEQARIVVNEAIRTMASIRDEADKLMAN
jgi:hypothetical protein